MSEENKRNADEMFAISEFDENTEEIELFSEELEDRFNAKSGSSFGTASCAGSCWTSLSTFCTAV